MNNDEIAALLHLWHNNGPIIRGQNPGPVHTPLESALKSRFQECHVIARIDY